MCGIAGLLFAVSREQARQLARSMSDALVHRGPDAEGLWQHEATGLCLAHRRLAIQDLSPLGRQPMQSAGGRYWIAFNGEIYNFREIAGELEQAGQHFRGGSDTEVMLQAIEHWGLEEALRRFVGMFAFALWDELENRLTLCRDRIGEKPLYYGWVERGFCFASELTAIERVAGMPAIDADALNDYLRNGYVSAPRSIYQGVFKLPPGCMLHLPAGSADALCRRPDDFSPEPGAAALSPRVYWSVREVASQGLRQPIADDREAVDRLEQSLRETLRRQLIADVDVGCFLSGGVDSSVVAALAQQEAAGALNTFTIGFEEKEYDESGYAEAVARHIGSNHLNLQVTSGDVLEQVPGIALVYDEPFADSSQLPAYLVSRLAKEEVTVCLSGDGGDELFAGYNRYLWTRALWHRLGRLPSWIRKPAGRMLGKPGPGVWDGLYGLVSRSRENDYRRQKLIGLKLQKLAGFMQQEDIHAAYRYLMSYWQQPEQLTGRPESLQDLAALGSAIPSGDFVDQAMFIDQNLYLPGDNLAKVDRASMAVSLETRLPLLSHELIELAWKMPVGMKVRAGVSKWALREVLYRHVPRELIERPKMGFSVPVARWLRHELREWGEDLLASLDEDLLSRQRVRQAWDEHQSGRLDHSHRLWTVLMFISWKSRRS